MASSNGNLSMEQTVMELKKTIGEMRDELQAFKSNSDQFFLIINGIVVTCMLPFK